MNYKYAKKDYDKENMARIVGRALPISTKFSVEICNFIRNKSTSEAKEILKGVAEGKHAIPFKIFNNGLSHKRGMGAGRFPKKPAIEIIKLLESVEANAQFKGLNTSNLQIKHICAHFASRPWHYGRQRRRKTKRTHIEIVVGEKKIKDTEKKADEKTKEKEIKEENKVELKQEKTDKKGENKQEKK